MEGLLMKLCVFCGSNSGKNPNFKEVTKQLGQTIASNGDTVVYGGGSVGLMGVIADSALQAGGNVIGIMPEFLINKEINHSGLTELIQVHDMNKRKQKMMEISDVFILLPGGIGSLEEFFDMFSASQMQLHKNPIVLFNIDNFFNPMLEMIDNLISEGFAPSIDKGLLIVIDNPNDMYSKLYDFKHKVGRKYVG
jgi:uncharacterized protein (TIGR00730 family)